MTHGESFAVRAIRFFKLPFATGDGLLGSGPSSWLMTHDSCRCLLLVELFRGRGHVHGRGMVWSGRSLGGG